MQFNIFPCKYVLHFNLFCYILWNILRFKEVANTVKSKSSSFVKHFHTNSYLNCHKNPMRGNNGDF